MTRLDGVVFIAMLAAATIIDLLHLWEMGALGVAIVVYGLIRRKAWKTERENYWYGNDRRQK